MLEILETGRQSEAVTGHVLIFFRYRHESVWQRANSLFREVMRMVFQKPGKGVSKL